jgi:tetratricopeptide (TPR) repeat protein
MRWQQTEFVFKGIYLGLLLFVGMALREPDWWKEIAQFALCTFGTLALFLGVAAARKLRDGCKVTGRLWSFLMYLVLENPGMVYAGVILGMLLGASSLISEFSLFGTPAVHDEEAEGYRLLYCVLGGACLGLAFDLLYHVHAAKIRQAAGFALGASMIGAGIFFLPDILPSRDGRVMLATLLLLGIPLFYLLTLAGLTEESEVEIMAICTALGISFWILIDKWVPGNINIQLAALLLPPGLYYVYTRLILPRLRVFKHVLRGIGYGDVGQFRPALVSLARALELDPRNQLARQQLWRVHRLMDFKEIVHDPATVALINFELCLERVATLLLGARPRPDQFQEAYRLLDLVADQRPLMRPRCDYWRAVAFTHEKRFDEAADSLRRVLVGADYGPENPHRRAILVPAWQLAVRLHPELTRRLGDPQLAIPGQRMEAIAAVESKLAATADDADAWDLKRILYADLTYAEYRTHVADGKAPEHFDHAYVHQLGLALVGDAAQWPKGCEFLRIAVFGLPALGPTTYLMIAKAYEKAGDFEQVWNSYELAKNYGKLVGPQQLGPEDRSAYFAICKVLGEDATKRGDTAAAIECYRLFAEYDRAGLQTFRVLAELHERNGDPWSALHATEKGLVFDPKDPDLLARKDRYYYSVTPEQLAAHLDQVRTWFDANYCKQKARWLLEHMGEDLELLDWATHLADLAQTAEPSGMAVGVLRARILRRRGENDQALALLEQVHQNKPEKFASSEEEEAWYLSCRMLGDLYLNSRPDQAVLCFQEYRKHGKSGADTIFKMGVAFENLADIARARKCYETVAAYDEHPLAPEARGALNRLQTSS